MEFMFVEELIKDILKKTGTDIDGKQYDSIIVKQLQESNTLDDNRTTNQTHIAITGAQIDMFPFICANGYFGVDYDNKNDSLKKHFVLQIPGKIYKSNLKYLGNDDIIQAESDKVYVSVFRSRRKDSEDQIQMSLTTMDTDKFILFRQQIHKADWLFVLKEEGILSFDFFAVKDADMQDDRLRGANNKLYIKKNAFTAVKQDEFHQEVLEGNTIDECALLGAKEPRNLIVFGAPGTGKSFTLNGKADALVKNGGYKERVTFHPDYSYANFVGSYKPVMVKTENDKEEISYKYVPGPFMRVLSKALKNAMTEKNPSPHLLIIEEINRANVAAVFGDVFQLLDRDENGVSEYEIATSYEMRAYLAKELGAAESEVETIRIPNNMFIWATMNSADQGVFPMDTAFKRRWEFQYIGIDDEEEKMPKACFAEYEKIERIYWNPLRKAINWYLSNECKINEDKLMGPFFISKSILEKGEEAILGAIKSKVLMYLFEDAGRSKRQIIFPNRIRYSDIKNGFDKVGRGIFAQGIQDKYNEYAQKVKVDNKNEGEEQNPEADQVNVDDVSAKNNE